ncbi:MAG: hypothetical protein QOJ06_676 [Pseudonocardiales bacterium]|nr:hypothetical protein [Pseudonocardiales bacterium]
MVGVQSRLLVVGLFIGLATNDGHAQRIGDQFGAHVLGNRPADDQPGIGVHHCGAVQDAFGGAVFGDIGNPQPVWRGDGEVAVDQIGAGCRVRGADRAAATSTPVEALDAALAHHSGDPFEVHRQPQPERQLSMDPR